jgi:hypothetical protein
MFAAIRRAYAGCTLGAATKTGNFSSPEKGVQFLDDGKRVQQKKPRRLTGAAYRRCYGHGPLVLMSV